MKKPSLRDGLLTAVPLLTKGSFGLRFDQLTFTYSNLPFRKRFNLFGQGILVKFRSRLRLGLPVIVQVEPTNQCNLQCLTCPTGAKLMKRPVGTMPFQMFQSVIDQVKKHAYLLVFWSWGEPFIHPDACRMIRYAKDCGLQVHTSTNGHFFDNFDRASALVDSGLDSLIIAVDGLDQATYSAYRKAGDLGRVMLSIKNLVAAKKALRSSSPKITFRFIVMKHNEHQVSRVVPFARHLGLDAVSFRSAVVQRSSVDMKENLTPQHPAFRRYGNPEKKPSPGRFREPGAFYCHRPYANLTIFSNGDVVACENDYNATVALGNLGNTPLKKILSSKEAKNFFRVFRYDLNDFDFCRSCDLKECKFESQNVKTIEL